MTTEPKVQALAKRLIQTEILHGQTMLVSNLLAAVECGANGGLLCWEDVVNVHRCRCPECGEEITQGDHEDPEGLSWLFHCESCGRYDDDADETPQDIMELEWWLVTPRMHEDLQALGEPVLTDGQSHWWGRTCSGQAIELDGTIQEVANRLIERTSSKGAN